jgi:hypothetical protein
MKRAAVGLALVSIVVGCAHTGQPLTPEQREAREARQAFFLTVFLGAVGQAMATSPQTTSPAYVPPSYNYAVPKSTSNYTYTPPVLPPSSSSQPKSTPTNTYTPPTVSQPSLYDHDKPAYMDYYNQSYPVNQKFVRPNSSKPGYWVSYDKPKNPNAVFVRPSQGRGYWRSSVQDY